MLYLYKNYNYIIKIKGLDELTKVRPWFFSNLVFIWCPQNGVHINTEYIYLFARDIENAPINKLANIVIKSDDAKYIYLFAKDVEKAPINKLAKAIIETNNTQYIRLFFKNIKNKSIARLSNTLEMEFTQNDIELENYNTLLNYTKENNYEQIKENKEEFASLFNNKSKKLIKKIK